MVSRENKVILLMAVVALVTLYSLARYTDAPSWMQMAALLIIGVIIPSLVNDYLDNHHQNSA